MTLPLPTGTLAGSGQQSTRGTTTARAEPPPQPSAFAAASTAWGLMARTGSWSVEVGGVEEVGGIPIGSGEGRASSLARSVSTPATGVPPPRPANDAARTLEEESPTHLLEVTLGGQWEDGNSGEKPFATLCATPGLSPASVADPRSELERPRTRRGHEDEDLSQLTENVSSGPVSQPSHTSQPGEEAPAELPAHSATSPETGRATDVAGSTAAADVSEVAPALSGVEDFPSSLTAFPPTSPDTSPEGRLRFLTGLQSFQSQEWQADSIPKLETGPGGLDLPTFVFEAPKEYEGWSLQGAAASGT